MKFHDISLKSMHEEEGRRKITLLEQKLSATKFNIEASKALIDHVPSNAERRRLLEKNAGRRRAVGSLQKEIQSIEQTLDERSREVIR